MFPFRICIMLDVGLSGEITVGAKVVSRTET